MDRSFWKAFTGQPRDGQRVELKWVPHGINEALHQNAPLIGVGAPLVDTPRETDNAKEPKNDFTTRCVATDDRHGAFAAKKRSQIAATQKAIDGDHSRSKAVGRSIAQLTSRRMTWAR